VCECWLCVVCVFECCVSECGVCGVSGCVVFMVCV